MNFSPNTGIAPEPRAKHTLIVRNRDGTYEGNPDHGPETYVWNSFIIGYAWVPSLGWIDEVPDDSVWIQLSSKPGHIDLAIGRERGSHLWYDVGNESGPHTLETWERTYPQCSVVAFAVAQDV